MPEAVNTASAFTIRELSGQQRTVRLAGRALPYRPFSLKTTQRAELTWLPGSPQASVTMLGAQDESTTITGMWKDKYLGNEIDVQVQSAIGTTPNSTFPMVMNGETIQTAREAEKLFDSITREGQLLEVTWDETTRHGILKTFSRDWMNTRDLGYEIRFDWTSRGEVLPPSVLTQDTGLTDASAQLKKQNDEMVENAQPSFPITRLFGVALSAALTATSTSVNDVQAATAGVQSTAIAPQEAQRRTVAACTGLIEQTDAVVAEMEARPLFGVDIGVPLASMALGRRMRAYAYSRTVIGNAQQLRRTAVAKRATMLNSMTTLLLGVYQAREGEDLRDVSRRYYGTPFEWRRLFLYNNLLTTELAAGQVLMIPKIEQGDRRS